MMIRKVLFRTEYSEARVCKMNINYDKYNKIYAEIIPIMIKLHKHIEQTYGESKKEFRDLYKNPRIKKLLIVLKSLNDEGRILESLYAMFFTGTFNESVSAQRELNDIYIKDINHITTLQDIPPLKKYIRVATPSKNIWIDTSVD